MTLHVPLSVTLTTAKGTKRVTKDLRALSFRSTVPGGYASAELTLDRRLIIQPEEIAYYGTVKVTDARNGSTVWEGRLEDQGRSAGSAGEVWQLNAVGPSAHALDVTKPYIVVDRRLDPWVISSLSYPAAQIDRADAEDQVASIQIQFMRNATSTGPVSLLDYFGDVTYHDIKGSGQKLARVSFDHISGVTDQNWRVKLLTRLDNGSSPGAVTSHQAATFSQFLAGKVGDANFVDGHNVANIRFDRDTSDVTVTDDYTYVKIRNIVLQAMLKTKTGVDITSGYTFTTVLASDVVADLLGRFLPKYDGVNASIETTTFNIQQFAFPEGVTPADVLKKLIELEPAFYWAVWESNAAGLHRFEWRSWPTSVRYDATVLDGIDSPASADGLYNAVNVIWRDPAGRLLSERRTQTVAELDAAGLTREHLIDLGEEGGGSADAIQVGDKFLAEHAVPPNAGALTVTRAILDRDQGRMVMPWEIEPGHLIRVRGIQPRIDSLNATERDGVSVFRIVSVDFSTSEAAATLELDAHSLTVARAVADLQRRRRH